MYYKSAISIKICIWNVLSTIECRCQYNLSVLMWRNICKYSFPFYTYTQILPAVGLMWNGLNNVNTFQIAMEPQFQVCSYWGKVIHSFILLWNICSSIRSVFDFLFSRGNAIKFFNDVPFTKKTKIFFFYYEALNTTCC